MNGYKLVGYRRMSGTSKKTGREYDCYALFLVNKSTDPEVHGEEASSVWVDSDLFDPALYQIGDMLDIRFDQRGRVFMVIALCE